jgi:hypothetical protein
LFKRHLFAPQRDPALLLKPAEQAAHRFQRQPWIVANIVKNPVDATLSPGLLAKKCKVGF